jgi:hypothetical protein
VVVMARMSNKLTGRDFSTSSSAPTSSIQHTVNHSTLISGDTREVDHGLSVKLQVQKLIIQARSHENLCQNYVGYDVALFSLLFFILHAFEELFYLGMIYIKRTNILPVMNITHLLCLPIIISPVILYIITCGIARSR